MNPMRNWAPISKLPKQIILWYTHYFVLHQISKNVDFYYFNHFINHLISEELNGKFVNGIEDRVGSTKKRLTRECSIKKDTGPEICYWWKIHNFNPINEY